MERENEINQNLIDQQVNSFIEKELSNMYEFSYSDLSFSYTNKDFYIKVVDKLIPHTYVNNKGFYQFPSEVLVRLTTATVHSYAKQTEEEFFKFLQKELSMNVGYCKYVNRLNTCKREVTK